MNYIQTEIDGVWLIEPKVLRDERGYFMEAFKEEEFKMHIGDVHFIQTMSRSLPSVYYVDYIIRKENIVSPNWYVL